MPLEQFFTRNINKFFQSGEFHNLLEPFAHFLPGKSHHRTVQVDVVPTGKFRMEPGPNFKKAGRRP